MIFVTVGTHEQPFDRLVKYVDELKARNEITEEVIIQTGFSTYEPKHCVWNKSYPYQEMIKKTKEARIVITHGGPSSFFMPLQMAKIPIVVPRQRQLGEHVNNHQVDFCRTAAERQGNIILVEDVGKLKDVIQDYESIISNMSVRIEGNNEKFNKEFEKIVGRLMGGGKDKDERT